MKTPIAPPDNKTNSKIIRRQPSHWLATLGQSTGVDIRARKSGVALLLLDCSESMNSGNRLHSATDGALKLNRDITSVGFDVGLILFSTEAELVCAPTRTGIESSLQGITCTGSTNLTAALRLALSNLSDRRQTRRVVIVATDGYPDDADTALEIAAVVKTEGIEILVVGTDDADRRFLEKLASRPESAIVTSGSQIGTGIVAVSKLLLPP